MIRHCFSVIMIDDYTRYIYFYLRYLVENIRLDEAKKITNNLDYKHYVVTITGKNWIEVIIQKNLMRFFLKKLTL